MGADVVDVDSGGRGCHSPGEPPANPEHLDRRRNGVLVDEPAPCNAGRPGDSRSRAEGCSDLPGAVLHVQLRHSGRQSTALDPSRGAAG